jgi:hypothetical protein
MTHLGLIAMLVLGLLPGRVRVTVQGTCRMHGQFVAPLRAAVRKCVGDRPGRTTLVVRWRQAGQPLQWQVLQSAWPAPVLACMRHRIQALPPPPQPCRAQVTVEVPGHG